MEEFRGTKGPWFVADDALGNMTHIVLSKQYPFEMMSKENLALITAAPELLESLKQCVEWLDIHAPSGSSESICVEESKAVIAKALGK
ncbi:hypothetical protein [Lelliottia sp. JS-SCA-14]|uniref:hypothetical protein n=1 Tax=Lelliottia sp. JS-SCA-14 TaxID=3110110 RepID=UPI002D76A6B3|nr:hypothetical protein [Lelliottia sp. JS-SCA-14]